MGWYTDFECVPCGRSFQREEDFDTHEEQFHPGTPEVSDCYEYGF